MTKEKGKKETADEKNKQILPARREAWLSRDEGASDWEAWAKSNEEIIELVDIVREFKNKKVAMHYFGVTNEENIIYDDEKNTVLSVDITENLSPEILKKLIAYFSETKEQLSVLCNHESKIERLGVTHSDQYISFVTKPKALDPELLDSLATVYGEQYSEIKDLQEAVQKNPALLKKINKLNLDVDEEFYICNEGDNYLHVSKFLEEIKNAQEESENDTEAGATPEAHEDGYEQAEVEAPTENEELEEITEEIIENIAKEARPTVKIISDTRDETESAVPEATDPEVNKRMAVLKKCVKPAAAATAVGGGLAALNWWSGLKEQAMLDKIGTIMQPNGTIAEIAQVQRWKMEAALAKNSGGSSWGSLGVMASNLACYVAPATYNAWEHYRSTRVSTPWKKDSWKSALKGATKGVVFGSLAAPAASMITWALGSSVAIPWLPAYVATNVALGAWERYKARRNHLNDQELGKYIVNVKDDEERTPEQTDNDQAIDKIIELLAKADPEQNHDEENRNKVIEYLKLTLPGFGYEKMPKKFVSNDRVKRNVGFIRQKLQKWCPWTGIMSSSVNSISASDSKAELRRAALNALVRNVIYAGDVEGVKYNKDQAARLILQAGKNFMAKRKEKEYNSFLSNWRDDENIAKEVVKSKEFKRLLFNALSQGDRLGLYNERVAKRKRKAKDAIISFELFDKTISNDDLWGIATEKINNPQELLENIEESTIKGIVDQIYPLTGVKVHAAKINKAIHHRYSKKKVEFKEGKKENLLKQVTEIIAKTFALKQGWDVIQGIKNLVGGKKPDS